MSSESRPYSLTNPPNAPKKRKGLAQRRGRLDKISRLRLEEPPREPEWRVLADTGYIRQKYLRWSPEDVQDIDDPDMLKTLRDYYTPSNQPQNAFEESYFSLMIEVVNDRLLTL